MKITKISIVTKVLAAIAFLIMITVNGLANALPINGQNTGQVSDAYGNLFAPAGLTFAIWGVIYLLLAMYILYQFGLFQKDNETDRGLLMRMIAPFFIASSFINAIWIFTWHYDLIGIAFLLIATMLILLVKINLLIDKETLTNKEKLFIRVPFAVYFAWLTVATIANATAFLVSISWNGFGISEVVWTVIILLIGAAIGFATIRLRRDISYGLVLVWAYGGILLKHISQDGFAMNYMAIIITVGASIALFVLAILLSFTGVKKQLNPSEV